MPSPSDPQSLNRYSYVNNNPVKYTDPTGHIGCKPGQKSPLCPSGQLPQHRIPIEDIQTIDNGVGDVYHRTYQVEIAGAQLSQQGLFDLMRSHLDWFTNSDYTEFSASNGPLQVGDKIDIASVPGVLTAVYVGEVAPNSFTLLTAKGHPEAGAIRFGVETNTDGNLIVRIESEARAATGLAGFAYEPLGSALGGRGVQTGLWTKFLSQAVTRSGGRYANITADGRATGPLSVQVTTEKFATPSYSIAMSRKEIEVINTIRGR